MVPLDIGSSLDKFSKLHFQHPISMVKIPVIMADGDDGFPLLLEIL